MCDSGVNDDMLDRISLLSKKGGNKTACITHDIGRKAALMVCLTGLIILLFSRMFPAQADAASDYKVEAWNSGSQFYTVYQGELPPMYGPDFYAESEDVFCNLDTGKNITITFYLPYDSPTQEQAEALYRYLLSESSAKYCWAGWYSASTAATDPPTMSIRSSGRRTAPTWIS
jgi:hypothetical protein